MQFTFTHLYGMQQSLNEIQLTTILSPVHETKLIPIFPGIKKTLAELRKQTNAFIYTTIQNIIFLKC